MRSGGGGAGTFFLADDEQFDFAVTPRVAL
jgi:hypothetical protein